MPEGAEAAAEPFELKLEAPEGSDADQRTRQIVQRRQMTACSAMPRGWSMKTRLCRAGSDARPARRRGLVASGSEARRQQR